MRVLEIDASASLKVVLLPFYDFCVYDAFLIFIPVVLHEVLLMLMIYCFTWSSLLTYSKTLASWLLGMIVSTFTAFIVSRLALPIVSEP